MIRRCMPLSYGQGIGTYGTWGTHPPPTEGLADEVAVGFTTDLFQEIDKDSLCIIEGTVFLASRDS